MSSWRQEISNPLIESIVHLLRTTFHHEKIFKTQCLILSSFEPKQGVCGQVPSGICNQNYRKKVLRVVSNSGYIKKLLSDSQIFKQNKKPTFQTHKYSSCEGGLITFFLFTSVTSSSLPTRSSIPSSFASSFSPTSNSIFFGGSPNSITAGSPFLKLLNFNVNLGPISCKTALSFSPSVLNAYRCLRKKRKSR